MLWPEPCYGDIDVAKMEQALMNICVNSIEAMPGGGELAIETAVSFRHFRAAETKLPNQPVDGEYVSVSVVDTGEGMDPATLQKIFDPFFTTKAKTGGTGLGLAMLYGVIDEFGGYVEVESRPASGTRFSFHLKLSERRPAAKDKEAEAFSDIPKGNGEAVLLVDDEPVVRELGTTILKQLDYRPIVAEDGLAGIDLYQKHRDEIAAVILDLIMPNMSGIDVLRRLRLANENVKIIVSTGYAKEELLHAVMDMKPTGFLRKPYKVQEMADALSRAIASAN